MQRGRAIGIDLGTTNTAVAVLDDGRPRVLEDAKGYKVLPSVVWIGDDGEVIVGQAAKSLLLTDPTRTVYAVKRVLGRRFDSAEVTDARQKVGYEITAGEDGSCLVEMEQGALSPVELSAHVLRTAKELAERALGEKVDEAVITVPAYFNHAQRAATMEAASLAGLHCERLLNEPTAAALAYGFKREVERTVVIFDLGGGTFDVSALRISSGVVEILATLGDSYLGGEDFDYRILDHLAAAFLSEHGVDLREERTTMHRLKDAAERAKCELSFTDKTTVLVPQVAAGIGLEMSLDRVTLEGLVEDYVERAISVTRQAVADAGLQISAVDEVILVGGQTRMPRIREAIAAMFDKEPSRSVHPEEVVAIGAAVHAASLVDQDMTPPVLIDVTPFDLGIDVAAGMFQPIIQRNSTIPTSAARVFATARSQQSSVRITVRQGAARMAQDNEFLGEFVMGGLTPAPRMETKVEVNFSIDANGMLHVSAMEPATGKSSEITVRNYAEVAQSKGQVRPKVTGIDAQEEEESSRGERRPQKASAGARPGRRRKKAAKAKAKGGGLLGALFGRQSKAKPAAPPAAEAAPPAAEAAPPEAEAAPPEAEAAPPEAEAAPPEAEAAPPEADAAPPEADAALLDEAPADEPSIIEAVAAERMAAAPAQETPAEPVEAMPVDEVEAAPAEDLEEAEDTDDPLYPSHAPDLGRGIVLPDLVEESLESLESESVDDLDEDPFGIGDGPAVVSVGAAPAPEAQAPEEEDVSDLFSDDILASDEALMDEDEDLGAEDPFGEDVDSGAPGAARVDFDSTMFDFATLSAEDELKEQEAPAPAPPAPDPPPDPSPSAFAEDETMRIPGTPPAEPPDEAPVEPPVEDPAEAAPPRTRRPARLKLSYKRPEAVAREYRENLSRGGCFVKTTNPLAVDREVRIEVRVPGLDEPMVITGVVTWSSRDEEVLEPGQEPGMGIEYRLDAGEEAHINELLDGLVQG